MIVSFRSKSLGELWSAGRSSRLDVRLHKRILRRLFELDAAKEVANLNAPGFDFHALRGFNPTRYTIHVNGPWCLTFEFENGEARHVDIEQYH